MFGPAYPPPQLSLPGQGPQPSAAAHSQAPPADYMQMQYLAAHIALHAGLPAAPLQPYQLPGWGRQPPVLEYDDLDNGDTDDGVPSTYK